MISGLATAIEAVAGTRGQTTGMIRVPYFIRTGTGKRNSRIVTHPRRYFALPGRPV
jgi:hypothetical protein